MILIINPIQIIFDGNFLINDSILDKNMKYTKKDWCEIHKILNFSFGDFLFFKGSLSDKNQ